MQKIERKEWWNELITMGVSVINKTKFGTAMDIILVEIALVTLPCLIIFAFTTQYILLIIAIVPVIQFIRVYDHYMKHDSKMVRTEKHEEIMYRMQATLGSKGSEMSEQELDALPATTIKKTSSKKPQLLKVPKKGT